ncbi:PEP/pyruvate-binding domain-containing protein [Parafrigoribacterium mesophilum]|uniref:PEP/pyruvate-binding domain-containing protein n=1 Tax=Parafrigoribacterium mesophilum TaxID=433646 RepID=UPI0031FBCC4F
MTRPHTFRRLDDPSGLPVESAGSKAATLARAAAAGFPVPPGFVVTAAALTALGDRLDTALQEAARSLGAGPFAVRSSAASEDLPDASYAGMYETYLDVEATGLGAAARRGFDAAADSRVAAYDAARRSTGAGRPTGMAMLVQQMVRATVAGVAFTANPLTGDRAETVITAVRGLGESLVSGDSVGEQWTVRAGVATCTRSAAATLHADTLHADTLDAEQALRIAELARKVQQQFGPPQDIEWAIDDSDRLFLLQARPMTALPDPVDWTAPGPGLWSRNFRLGEWLPEAMTPLFAQWLLPALESGYLDGMTADAHVRVPFRFAIVNGWYYNAAPIPSAHLLWRVLADSRGRAPWLLYNALARVSLNPAAADRAVLHRLETAWRQTRLPALRMLVERSAREVPSAPLPRVMQIAAELCRSTGEYLWSLSIVGGSAWKMEGALAKFWRRHLAGPLAGTSQATGGHQLLLRGLPGAEPRLLPHGVSSLDWFHPTAGETQPDSPEPTVNPTRAAAVIAARIDCEQACRTALAGTPKLLARFNELVAVTQHYAVLREEQARDLSLGWPVLRRCARRLAELLLATGTISAADQVFFLNVAELADASADHSGPAQARRTVWERQRRLVAPITLGVPPRLIGDPIGRAVAAVRTATDLPEGAVVGHPASTGRATGRVRFIRGPEDFDSFVAGEVLLAKATAPAWTPLFDRAAAVVTDGGTLAAHASLVAREFGIPAVVGTGDATSRLHTGQLVQVDGGAGTVLPLEPPMP